MIVDQEAVLDNVIKQFISNVMVVTKNVKGDFLLMSVHLFTIVVYMVFALTLICGGIAPQPTLEVLV